MVKVVQPVLICESHCPPGTFFWVSFDDDCGFALSCDEPVEIHSDGTVIKAMCSHGLEVAVLIDAMRGKT